MMTNSKLINHGLCLIFILLVACTKGPKKNISNKTTDSVAISREKELLTINNLDDTTFSLDDNISYSQVCENIIKEGQRSGELVFYLQYYDSLYENTFLKTNMRDCSNFHIDIQFSDEPVVIFFDSIINFNDQELTDYLNNRMTLGLTNNTDNYVLNTIFVLNSNTKLNSTKKFFVAYINNIVSLYRIISRRNFKKEIKNLNSDQLHDLKKQFHYRIFVDIKN